MTKRTATPPADLLDALLGGLDVRGPMPGTRPDIAEEVAALDDRLSPLLAGLPQADPPPGLFDAIEAEIDAEPASPVSSMRAGEGTWDRLTDKIWRKVLARDPDTGRRMYLLRCLPGAVIKPHPHKRAEHLFVIEGECWIDGKLFTAGDAQASRADSVHAEITMPNGCLVLVSA